MAEDFEVGGDPLPEESTNRTFVIAAAGLGAVLILSMICLAAYALYWAPRQRVARETEIADRNIQNTQQAQTQTAEAIQLLPTATSTPTGTASPTGTVTPTQVVVLPTDTPTPFITFPTLSPEEATAAAQATAAAGLAGTPTPTALPATGFVEDVGIPTILLIGGLLVAVVIVARSLRARTAI